MLQRGLFDRARLRLAAWYVVFLAIILVVLDLGVLSIIGSALESKLDQDLQHKAQQASAAIGFVGGSSGFDRAELASDSSWSDVSLYAATSSGAVLVNATPFAPAVLPESRALSDALAGRPGYTNLLRTGEPFIVYTQPVYRPSNGGNRVVAVVQVARPARTLVDANASVVSLLLGATAVSLVLAFVAGLWLADKALKPIRVGLLQQKEFVSDASHELRTPVTVIRTAAESILRQKQTASPRVTQLAQDIVSETVQLGRMVADLGVLAQADSRGGVRRDPVEVAALLDEAAASGRLLAESHGAHLEVEVDVGGVVQGDEVRLRQLFAILLDNATRFSPPGGHVTFTAAVEGNRVRCGVRDHGPGIDAAELPRIFDRFYRGADQRQHEGSGLGLSIAQWIVQEHGGTISVRSQVGAGSEFLVELPLAP
ncbi:MAG: HAMP domain-containing histidine kinase [Candidatus Dormibacteraeota bacterium]|nr:HAMP domain-containing histidine kinase [Candidatus Dormibacteraeota bacterium]